MMKARKVALWSVAAVVSVLVVGAAALHFLTDSAQLKKLMSEHVRKTYSRDLLVDDLFLSFTPMPGIHATGVSVSNPAWAREKIFLQAKVVDAQLALIPLLTGRFVIDDLSVDGFKLNLEKTADGRNTWSPDPSSSSTAAQPPKTKFGALSLKNGAISFRGSDPATPEWQVDHVQFDTRSGLREVAVDFSIARNEQLVHVQGKFDDLSQIGAKDAISKGNVRAQAGAATLVLEGELPLDLTLQRYRLKATIDANSLRESLAFLGMARRPQTSLKASANLEADGGSVNVSNVLVQFGKLNAKGDARITKRADRQIVDAHVDIDRMDWVQLLLDAGFPPLPPRPAGELFYDNPLAWNAIVASPNIEGTLHTRLAWLKMRSGIEVTNTTAEINIADGRVHIKSFSADALGGKASGTAVLNGSAHSAQVDLRLKDALLGTWMTQTHKKTALVGGRTQLHANITATGASMKKLAASFTGPVTIETGRATIQSKKLSDAESLLTGLTPFFATKGNDQVDLICFAARLPFKQGIASGDAIVGIRSEASQLLASGSVNLRDELLDLHGPIKARSGISLGVSTFASEVRIDGKIATPVAGLDKAAAPSVIARIAAAITTGGASIIGTTIWDGAQAAPNPCQVVLAAPAAVNKKMSAKPRKN